MLRPGIVKARSDGLASAFVCALSPTTEIFYGMTAHFVRHKDSPPPEIIFTLPARHPFPVYLYHPSSGPAATKPE